MNRIISAGAAAVFSLVSIANAFAQADGSVFLEDMTWTELRDAIANGAKTVIVPIGGTEQNGPAMALGKHNARVKVLSERIARALGGAIVAPVIAYVPEGGLAPPTQHMRFPGTITIPETAFLQTLEAAARSLRLHGFHSILFLGDHGGYQALDREAAGALNREWAGGDARAYAIEEYYAVTQSDYVKALKQKGLTDAEIGLHAGAADTALTLALAPQMVRADRLRTLPPFGPSDGVYGDPTKASAELGAIGVDLIVSHTVAAIRAALAGR